MPHTPLGIFNVPFVAGDDVNMDMEYALPGRWPDIDADIVAIRIKLLVNEFSFLFYEAHAGSHFFRRQVEKTGDMPPWDDQGVPRTRRVGVTGAESKFMLYRYPTRIFAKQAWIIGVSFLLLWGFRRQQNTSCSIYTLYFDTESC
jgi:hypothetical protein